MAREVISAGKLYSENLIQFLCFIFFAANPQPDNDSFSSGSESENDRTMPKMSSIQQTKTNKQTSTAKKPKKKRSSRKNIPVSSAELAKLLIEMVETGLSFKLLELFETFNSHFVALADMSNALEWIKECIDDLVDDLENDPDDDGEGVPIVPIMESAVSAMDNNDFLKLLQAFGFHEPSDEQVGSYFYYYVSTLQIAIQLFNTLGIRKLIGAYQPISR